MLRRVPTKRSVREVSPAGPVSVQLDDSDKRDLAAEARFRGLGLSTTVRVLAKERLGEIREERQLTRARRWQLARLMRIADRVEAGDVSEVGQAEIDRIFDDAVARIEARTGPVR